MTNVSRTFQVKPDPQTVIEFLKDFSHAEEWDPGTDRCEKIGDGPIGVGTQFDNVSTIAGNTTQLTYTLEKLTSDTIVFVGRNDTATATDTITVLPDQVSGGSELTYDAHIELHGVAKVMDPAMKLVFEKIGSDTEDDLTKVLNALV